MRNYKSKSLRITPKAVTVHISKSMQSNKSSGTKPELILAKLLRKKLYKNNLPGNPDFIYPKRRLAVFVHGCFWHRCSRCNLPLPKTHRSFWKSKFERNVERDRLNRKELKHMGWKVIEVWEHEINKDPKTAADRIKNHK